MERARHGEIRNLSLEVGVEYPPKLCQAPPRISRILTNLRYRGFRVSKPIDSRNRTNYIPAVELKHSYVATIRSARFDLSSSVSMIPSRI